MSIKTQSRRVVIVDDSRTILAMLDSAFSRRDDFEVVGYASDATSAVKIVRDLVPDIVTVDLCMPYIDGAKLLEMLSDMPMVCKIIVSDKVTSSAIFTSRLQKLGAAGCVGKKLLMSNKNRFFDSVNSICTAFKKTATEYSLPSVALKTSNAARPLVPSNDAFPIRYPVCVDEDRRLDWLAKKHLANLTPEPQFDLLTKYLADLTFFPIALINFLDQDTLWIKSAHGLENASFPRSEAFCSFTVADDRPLIVGDATRDKRFSSMPSVTGEMNIRAYAGYPIICEDGTRVGTVCLADQQVRVITYELIKHLTAIADITAAIINCRSVFDTPSVITLPHETDRLSTLI